MIEVSLGGRSYPVQIGRDILPDFAAQAAPFLSSYAAGTQRAVPFIADSTVHRHHGGAVERSLSEAGFAVAWFLIEPGESSKSWPVLEKLVDWLLERGVTRSDTIFALGGGVVGDLAGFAASIVKRGCSFVQIPTTLLAQVDSSVGGKTAINTVAGKNLVGTFHQPAHVFVDLATLETLPERELRAGFAEVVKYGVLGDAGFFAWLEANHEAVLALEEDALSHAVSTSIAMKARIVAQDERETTGARALLNLGHTFGHALEAATGFSDRLLHGEAVALGMVLAARYSARRGLLRAGEDERVAQLIKSAGLPTEIAALELDTDGEALAAHMAHDKKMEANTLPFILLRAIGDAFVDRDVAMADVAAFLDEELRQLGSA